MEKVRLGIIGIGSMGTGHAGNVLKGMVPDMELTAVADIRQSRLDWARNNLPETVKVFDDGRKMIDSGSCDAVLVATPHYLHPESSSMHWSMDCMRSAKNRQESTRNRYGR